MYKLFVFLAHNLDITHRSSLCYQKIAKGMSSLVGVGGSDAGSARRTDPVLIGQGAEARVSLGKLLGKKCIIKERFQKKYRHKMLDDQLRKSRTIQEARCLARCRSLGISAPAVYYVHDRTKTIYMEYVEGVTVKDFFKANTEESVLPLRNAVAKLIGESLASIHNSNMVHGDPTTSNMVLTNVPTLEEVNGGKLTMIDFGLGFQNANDDDKAVDLYVLERAMLSTHPNTEVVFQTVLEAYKALSVKAKSISRKFEAVRARGRKRMAFG